MTEKKKKKSHWRSVDYTGESKRKQNKKKKTKKNKKKSNQKKKF